MKKGFTLLEILLAVAAIGILASIVIIAINPGRQLAIARNARRQSDVAAIANAIYQYSVDHDGVYPPGINTSTQMLGTASSGCTVLCGAVAQSSGGGSSGSSGSNGNLPYSSTDSGASAFNQGIFSGTLFDATNNGVELSNPSNIPSGTYLSPIKSSGSNATSWTSLSWVPEFPAKPLPDFGQSETGYPSGNASMANNVLLMHLDDAAGATSFTDTSGNNNNGTCGSACPTAGSTGLFGTAATFDGLKSDIYVPDNTALEYTGGNMTLSAWVYLNGTETSGGNIFSKPWNGGGQYNYRLYFNSNRTIGVNLVGATSYILTSPTTAEIPQNAWTYVAATVNNAGQVNIYMNGALVTSGTSTVSSWVPTSGNIKASLVIGGLYPYATTWAGNTSMVVDGKIDEAAIYTRALSGGEILNSYKRGAGQLKFQVRSCPDRGCSSGTFIGPDGTANTYYSESNAAVSPPTNIALVGIPTDQYFQYKAYYNALLPTISPGLSQITVSGNYTPAGTTGSSNPSSPSSTADSGSSQFNQGVYTNTIFNATDNGVELINPANNPAGTYVSKIKDSGNLQTDWQNISWVPEFPTGKQLPDYGQNESGYPSGNMNMSGNIGLWHLDGNGAVSTGQIVPDTSGLGNNGTASNVNGTGLNYASGVINQGLFFDGIDDNVSTNLNIQPSALPTMTFAAWVYPTRFGYTQRQAIFSDDDGGYDRELEVETNNNFAIFTGNGVWQPVAATLNQWQHVVVEYTPTDIIFYKNGIKYDRGSAPASSTTKYNLTFGRDPGYTAQAFAGGMDEISVWNIALSDQQVAAIYHRGASQLKFQLRTCSDPNCSAAPAFVGPDGTSGSYFTESNTALNPPTNISLYNVPANEYVQYKTYFNSLTSNATPGLTSVSIGYGPPAAGAQTASSTSATSGVTTTLDACLDLSSSLVSDYITAVPTDPQLGSSAKTYYAVGESSNGGLTVTACDSENNTLVQTKL